MAAFEGSQKNMLQGVSQQLQRERLEGQVSAQNNMLSDVVTGLRRRPGAEVKTAWVINNAFRDRIVAWDSDVATQRVKCVLNGVDGVLRICDPNWGIIATLQHSYFQFTNRNDIQQTVTDDRMFILNKERIPYVSATNGGIGSARCGFFFIKLGAFDTLYSVTMTPDTGVPVTAQYRTPKADNTEASNQSTPTYITQMLINDLRAKTGWGVAGDGGAYVFFRTNWTTCSTTSQMSTSYIGTSGASHVPQIVDLPARLPTQEGYTVAVGSTTTPTYYRWSGTTNTWKESPAEGSPSALGNMPISISLNASNQWVMANTYEGRLSGDDNSSPNPSFLGYGLDGIGSFQGRLVLLNGSKVSMSASGRPERFYRATVEAVLASDPIEVGASANSSAAYQYCVPFNKDLLLFSEKYQALVPGGGTVVTPNNATVVVTSTYEADMSSVPLSLGRTVMFAAPRSKDFFGLLEMLPSPYTDSQYVSSDVTAHLPKYMNGRCRFSVSSSVSGIAVFASTTDYRALVVHEYTWDGDAKAQQAWHKWTFPYDIADAFFSGSEISLVFVNNGQLLVATLDPRVGTLTVAGERRPFLDIYFPATVTKTDADRTVGGVCAIPAFYQQFDPAWYTKARLADRSNDLLGEEVGIEGRTAGALLTVPSFGAGSVNMGIGYRSMVSPSMPSVKDTNGVVISSNKLTLLRFMIGTENSYEYEAIVQDSADDGADNDEELATLYWGSAELDLGDPRISIESTAILPCRTNAASTTVLLFTDSLGELNIVSLEYVCRYNQKLKRR